MQCLESILNWKNWRKNEFWVQIFMAPFGAVTRPDDLRLKRAIRHEEIFSSDAMRVLWIFSSLLSVVNHKKGQGNGAGI